MCFTYCTGTNTSKYRIYPSFVKFEIRFVFERGGNWGMADGRIFRRALRSVFNFAYRTTLAKEIR